MNKITINQNAAYLAGRFDACMGISKNRYDFYKQRSKYIVWNYGFLSFLDNVFSEKYDFFQEACSNESPKSYSKCRQN